MAENSHKQPAIPKKLISEYMDDQPLESIMSNAKKKGENELWWNCFRRRCELRQLASGDKKTALEREFDAIMHAYDMLRWEETKKRNPASRTWNMVKDKGVKAVLEKWALSKTKESGFKLLMEQGHYDLTGEFLVLKHSGDFSPEVVAAARKCLVDAGVSEEELKNI